MNHFVCKKEILLAESSEFVVHAMLLLRIARLQNFVHYLSLSLSLSHTHTFFRIFFRYRAHHIAVGLADPPQTRNCHCTDATITKGNGRCF